MSQSSDIRQLVIDDWRSFKDIRLDGLKKAPDAFGDSYEEALDRGDESFKERVSSSTIIGSFIGDRLVSVAGFYCDQSLKCQHIANIWGVYTREGFRGEGHAKKVFKKILEMLPEHIEQVRLSVGEHNQAARSLYSFFDFEECGLEEKVLKIEQKYYNEILMVKFIK